MFKQPNISDWANWVSPSSLRNYIIKDCILDWLRRYGESKGFIRDDHLPGFDPDINFNQFILAKGKKFEEAIIEVLKTKVDITHIEKSSSGDNITAYNNTLEAMFQGKPAIYQGFLRDIDNKLYGRGVSNTLQVPYHGTKDNKSTAKLPIDYIRLPLIAFIGWYYYGEIMTNNIIIGSCLIIFGTSQFNQEL